MKSYVCPHCQQQVNVDDSVTAPTLMCSACWQEFDAATSQTQGVPAVVTLPEKLPFFKSGRKQILRAKVQELNADGELSEIDENVLEETAILLGLTKEDLEEIEKEGFFKEFEEQDRAHLVLHRP